MKISNNKILITGGATGIGLGLAEMFIKEHNEVIICGRREDALSMAAEKFPGLITKQCDLSSEEQRIHLYEWIADNHSDLTVLVNNAGIQNWMNITDADFFEKAKTEIAINIEAPIHLTALFIKLPSMQSIINVTSGLSFMPFAKIPVYSATKAFFRSFTLSLRHLLKEKNIEVIELIPPALNTDLGAKGLHSHAPAVSEFISAVHTQLKNGKDEIAFDSSETRLQAVPRQWKDIFEKMHNN